MDIAEIKPSNVIVTTIDGTPIALYVLLKDEPKAARTYSYNLDSPVFNQDFGGSERYNRTYM